MKKLIPAICFAFLAACTTMQEHEAKPFDTQFRIEENYQAVYAATLRTISQCFNPPLFVPTGYGIEQISAELFPDLGYGEITRYQVNYRVIPLSTIRVERQGNGTLVSIKTSSAIQYVQRYMRAWLIYWAKGGTECQESFELPPKG